MSKGGCRKTGSDRRTIGRIVFVLMCASFAGCSNQTPNRNARPAAVSIDSARVAEDWFYRAIGEYEPGNRDSALKLIDSALAYRRDYPQAWHLRGSCLGSLDSFKEAKAAYDEALRLKPDYANAWWHRGCLHASSGLPDSALEDLRQAIAIDSGYRTAPFEDDCWRLMRGDPRLLSLTK